MKTNEWIVGVIVMVIISVIISLITANIVGKSPLLSPTIYQSTEYQILNNSRMLIGKIVTSTDGKSFALINRIRGDIKITSDRILMNGSVLINGQKSVTTDCNIRSDLLVIGDNIILRERETITLYHGNDRSYDVSTDFISSSAVRLKVNGELTNSLSVGESWVFLDNLKVQINQITSQGYAGSSKIVNFNLYANNLALSCP